MKKFCIVLVGLLFLVLNTTPGYCDLNDYLTKRKILKWNKANGHEVRCDIKTISFSGIELCFKDSTIENNSPDTIEKIIIPLVIFSNKKEVLRRNVVINKTIYPSATVTFNPCFNDEGEIQKIRKQLGDSFGWTYNKPVSIPHFKDEKYQPQADQAGIKLDYYNPFIHH